MASEPGTSGRFLAIARILRPQGRKGEVAAEVTTSFPDRFRGLGTVFLAVPGQPPRAVRLENSWPHKGQIVLKLSGIDSIESAEALRGLELLIPWEERTVLPPQTYYVCELEGCHVVGRDGREIGTVTEVEATGGVDILHVRAAAGRSDILIPLAQEICTRVDTAARIIVIDPPADLIGLNEVTKRRSLEDKG